jgi:hypothetical protein
LQFFVGELFHGGIATVLFEQGPGFGDVVSCSFQQGFVQNQGLEASPFPGQGLKLGWISGDGRISQLRFERLKRAAGSVEALV